MRNVSLKDLSPDTQYTVNVDARALTGISKSSDEKFTTTKFGKWSIRALRGMIQNEPVSGLSLVWCTQYHPDTKLVNNQQMHQHNNHALACQASKDCYFSQ